MKVTNINAIIVIIIQLLMSQVKPEAKKEDNFEQVVKAALFSDEDTQVSTLAETNPETI